jgi:peptidoglycan hydrolase CwlO-like protein
MKKLGCVVFALLAVVIVIGCVAQVVQRDNVRKSVGQEPDAVENMKTTAQDIVDAVDDIEKDLEDGPVGTFFDGIDNQGQ